MSVLSFLSKELSPVLTKNGKKKLLLELPLVKFQKNQEERRSSRKIQAIKEVPMKASEALSVMKPIAHKNFLWKVIAVVCKLVL